VKPVRRAAGGMDFELNLAPVIDCMVVLIAFVLISASFLSINILEGSYAHSAASAGAPARSTADLMVTLHAGGDVAVQGAGSRSVRLSAKAGRPDWSALDGALSKASRKQVAVISADDRVGYADVAEAMARVARRSPQVVLAGFNGGSK
jgi:biopolymer transport protein ExbD